MKAIAVRTAIFAATAYIALAIVLYCFQDRLIFPAPKTFEKRTPADSGIAFQDLSIPVVTRDHLHAWWVRASILSPSVILIFHGNAYVLEDMIDEEIPNLRELGTNLLLIDYRGYGSSSPVTPNEATVDEDAEAALLYLMHDRHISPKHVFVLGRSIGSGPATYVASIHANLAGLILESPFSSIDEAGAGTWYARVFPIRLLLRTHFNTLSRINSVRIPLLIVSGTADTLTPPRMASAIYTKAHEPKQIYLVPKAGHNDLVTEGGPKLVEVLSQFVQEQR